MNQATIDLIEKWPAMYKAINDGLSPSKWFDAQNKYGITNKNTNDELIPILKEIMGDEWEAF